MRPLEEYTSEELILVKETMEDNNNTNNVLYKLVTKLIKEKQNA